MHDKAPPAINNMDDAGFGRQCLKKKIRNKKVKKLHPALFYLPAGGHNGVKVYFNNHTV